LDARHAFDGGPGAVDPLQKRPPQSRTAWTGCHRQTLVLMRARENGFITTRRES
jgi:hypothetical protein